MTAVNRCAPPANRPTPEERDNCLPYLERELELLSEARVLLALGSFAWDGALRAVAGPRRRRPAAPSRASGTAAEPQVGRWTLLGCFHPSQQNTFTGKLTEPMMDAVFTRARELAAQ